MAIGNGDETEEQSQPQAFDTSCSDHKDTKVALFCQTCGILICSKCVSFHQNKHSRHRDHVYMDLVQAYDIQKENLQKMLASFQDSLCIQSNKRQKLHQRLQKLKFEVLRKKTQLSRCARSLKSKIAVNERACQRQLEKLMQPAIERTDDVFQEVDYDVVSGSGLLGAAESLQGMSVHDRVPFLKNVCRIIREMDTIRKKHYTIRDSEGSVKGIPRELLDLGSISIDRDREKRPLCKVLLLATNVPSKPKLLTSWCTVGSNSASIIWKYNKSDVIDKFVIRYHPTETVKRLGDGERSDGCGHVVINQFMSGRVQATLLSLKPDAEYVFYLSAINRCGKSESLVARLRTSPVTKTLVRGVYFPTGNTVNGRSRTFVLSMFLIWAALILLLFLGPWLYFGGGDSVCDKLYEGKSWRKVETSCWNHVLGTEFAAARRYTVRVVTQLVPQRYLHYILPEVKEERIVMSDKWWFEWFDFEL